MPEIVSDSKALFGKYEVGKLLGCGAFAKVYHARNVSTGQSVAIKVINKKKISGSNLMNNIKREISIMRRLHHPNIVNLFEVLATRSKIYFVMEYVKGGELFAKISKGRFSEDLARKFFHQLISAVSFCHSRGIFHRDLKPENLLVDESGNLKVSDFGLSALTDQIRSDGLLHTLCGTPAYVAPEILSKKGYDGAKVDVWSCGVVLFVLVAGYLPFNDPNLMAMYKKIYKGEYRCPKWMSVDFKRLLSRLLDVNPATRITVDDILRDPWFKKGGLKAIKLYDDDFWCKIDDSPNKATHLNAFDIISFSSGLDLSGLLAAEPADDGDRFVSAGSPEEVIEKVEEIARAEKVRVMRRKDWGLELGGQNDKLAMGVEVYRLTEDKVVVESRRRGGDAERFNDMWRNRLKPQLQLQQQHEEEASTSTSSPAASATATASTSTSGN